ncbi:MAG: MBL fold metallo-hydrolase [Oscillospiraceae bacterium]|nr:MBL fold metallo-hydrolase [Oscillospiraceae bacterium]
MKLVKLPPMGSFEVNGYLIISESGSAFLIDAPCGADRVIEAAKENNAEIKKILLTHGHFDHIEALEQLCKKTGARVYIHENDAHKLNDPRANLSALSGSIIKGCENADKVKDGDAIALDELSVKVFHTPGHTSGSVCYMIENMIFSGDTLFYMSIGRTDLTDGNSAVLADSLKRLAEFKGGYDDYRVLAGHGDETSLSFEIKNNPYLGRFDF